MQNKEQSAVISLYESKHKEKDTVATHTHDTHQLLYVLDGDGACELDEHVYDITADSFLIVPPKTRHSIRADSHMTVLVLELDAGKLSRDVRTQLIPNVFGTARVQSFSAIDSSELRQIMRKMLYEQSHGDQLWQMALKIHIAELLCTLARSNQDAGPGDTNKLRVERLRQYIDTRYYDIESAEDIAGRMGMSKRYMQTIFKEYYERTPMQYLTEVRLGLVKQLLLESDKDIVSICFEVGFESLSTFYRLFKKHVGVPPNMYRTTQRSREGTQD
jgi:AraC-like DNA-binding protein/quercetin dioxygenase-like cupin family protein